MPKDNERIIEVAQCPGRLLMDSVRVAVQILPSGVRVFAVLIGNVRIECKGYTDAFDLLGNLVESGQYDVSVS